MSAEAGAARQQKQQGAAATGGAAAALLGEKQKLVVKMVVDRYAEKFAASLERAISEILRRSEPYPCQLFSSQAVREPLQRRTSL